MFCTTNSYAVPCAGVVIGTGPLHRDALVEAHELHRDLALIVALRHNAVELAVPGPDEDGVARERTLHGDPIDPPDEFHTGSGVVGLLPAELTALPRVELRAATASRGADPGAGT